MIWTIDPAIEAALWRAARAHLSDDVFAPGALSAAIVDRSRRYTSERERLAAASDADLAARALFFTVADAPKIKVPLAELAGCELLPARPLRIADLGAGAGAMTLGAIDFLGPARPVTVDAYDSDGAALAILEDVVADFAPAATVRCHRGDVTRARLPDGCDLILAGTVINELPADARARLVRAALAALAPAGSLVIIEPALRDTSRALHELRDHVLAEKLATVFAPCTRAIAPCPMLADERDWCHEDRATELPERAAQLAGATGLRAHGLKFSYLVLRKDDARLVPGGRRVVSHLAKQKGKIHCFACDGRGRLPVRLLRRNRTDANRSFERAGRGDVLVMPATEDIGKDDAVDLIRPAERDAR